MRTDHGLDSDVDATTTRHEHILRDCSHTLFAVDRVNAFADVITLLVSPSDADDDRHPSFYITIVEMDWRALRARVGEPVVTAADDATARRAHRQVLTDLRTVMEPGRRDLSGTLDDSGASGYG